MPHAAIVCTEEITSPATPYENRFYSSLASVNSMESLNANIEVTEPDWNSRLRTLENLILERGKRYKIKAILFRRSHVSQLFASLFNINF